MKIKTVLFVLTGLVNCLYSQSYYFSSSTGDDITGDGTIGNPWASVTQINALVLGSDDTVFLKRGDVFEGEIILDATEDGINLHPIVFTGYGVGVNPVISGVENLQSTWTPYPSVSGAYQINSSKKVKQLIVNGTPIESARYPNSSFLRVDSMYASNTGFYDDALSGIGFNPSTKPICVRSSLWTWETRKVNSYNNSPAFLIFDTPPQLDSFPNYGYFFYNDLSLIDTLGEWYSDTIAQTVYYYPSNGSTPSSQIIDGSVYNYGIKGTTNTSFITIKGLDFYGQYIAGVDFGGPGFTYNSIDSCNFSAQYLYGINIGGIGHAIAHTTFKYIEGRGVFFNAAQTSTLIYSDFNNMGMFRSGGTNDQDNFTAVTAYGGSNLQININSIDSIGYCGIRCDAPGSYVGMNILSNNMLLLTDGGSIKAFGSFATISIENNFINNCSGNNAGAPVQTNFHPAALYLDFYTDQCTILNNTVENVGGNGIFINGGSDNHYVKGNIIYGAIEHMYTNDRFIADPIDGDSILNNVFYCTSPAQICVREGSRNDYIMGGYDNNYYVNPYTENHLVRRISTGVNDSFDLANWQINTGFDMNTKDTYFNWTWPTSNDTLIKNMTLFPITVDITSNLYFDLDSNVVCWPFQLDPYSSRVLINSGTQCPLGIDPYEDKHLVAAVYPNPASQSTQVFISELNKEASFDLFSMSGQVVKSTILTNTITTVPLEGIAPGIYLYRIVSRDNSVATGKLIVQ